MGMLVDVHKYMQLPTNPSRTTLLINGSYEYHHYGQGAKDFGWGCAYRSCQTLISYFKFKGEGQIDVPTIAELQKILVSVGDKPKSFLGSTQWIGSVEVGILVEHCTQVPCKILHVHRISDAYEDIIRNFETHAAPIMIGGNGGGARAILGVELCDGARTIARVLALDPHNGGPDDAAAVRCGIDGVCCWADPVALARQYGAFVNLCLPAPTLAAALPSPAGPPQLHASAAAAAGGGVAVVAASAAEEEDSWEFEVIESG